MKIMESHQMMPTWQRDNARACEEAMLRLLSKGGRLSNLAISAVQAGRKLRASLALQYLNWAGLEAPAALRSILHECLAKAEFLHSASCILDDIIDGDTMRRGQPVFHVREGLPQAILAAQELIAMACTKEESHPDRLGRSIQDALLTSVRESIRGEACDSFPLHDTLKYVADNAELETAYLKKTTPGFAVAYQILGIVFNFSDIHIERMAAFGGALGAYYQLANDYHDWFSLSPEIRGDAEDEVLVSLCIPTIVALGLDKGNDVRSAIGTKMSRQRFAQFVTRCENLGVEKIVKEKVSERRSVALRELPLEKCPSDLLQLFAAIDSSEFWSYKYRVS